MSTPSTDDHGFQTLVRSVAGFKKGSERDASDSAGSRPNGLCLPKLDAGERI